jgi:predicted P-loop ATPase
VNASVPPSKLAFYSNERDNDAEVVEATWEEIVELLTIHQMTPCIPCKGKTCPSKKGLAFSPAPPTHGRTRADKHVELVYLLAFDFDGITWAELEGVCQRLEGLESVLHTTHSHLHDGPEDCRVRIVLPLWRPVTPSEFYVLHAEVRRRYGLQWYRPGATKASGADPVVKDLSRLFYTPSAPEGSTPFATYAPGAMLDIETLLREAPHQQRAAPKASAPRVERTPSGPVDMEALRQALRDYKPRNSERDDGKISRKELVRRVLAGEPLVKHEETGLRNDAVVRLGSILGFILPADAPEEAVLELVRPSINALPVYPNDDENDSVDKRFEVFKGKWQQGIEAAESQRAALELKRHADRELHKKLKQRFKIKGQGEAAAEKQSESDEGAAEESSEEDLDLENWEDLLKRSEKGKVLSLGTNVELILDAHPEWREKVSYNEFTKSPELASDVPIYAIDTEEQVTAVQHWIQYEYDINLTRMEIMAVVRHVAKKKCFNPIKDYLNALKWDGAGRIDDWLVRYCRARTRDDDGTTDITAHVQRVGRRWLMAAVARALEPGCKADTVLILEGEQGKKKSMVFEVLAGRDWFTDSPVHIGQKDAMQIVGTRWIIEMAELSSFHGSETEQQKQFFSSRVDTFRPPFALSPASFPRHAVFGGTTNKTNYLNDETGNRRFWAVWCENIFISDLERDRDQLWAEAVHFYKAGLECRECKRQRASNEEARCVEHRWWLDSKENEQLEVVNNQRLRNEYADGILDYMLKYKPEERPTWLTYFDVCKQLNINVDRMQAQASAIGRALKTLKFKSGRVMQNGTRLRVYLTPEDILAAPQVAKIRGAPRPRPQTPIVGLA